MASPKQELEERRNAPVSLRLGNLAADVYRRKAVFETVPSVIRRDLERYYLACEASLRKLAFDYPEARLLVDMLTYTTLKGEAARFIWAELDERVRAAKPPLNEQEKVVAEFLINRLRGISVCDALAIIDAIEIFRDTVANNGNDVDAALDESRLTLDLPDEYFDSAHEKWQAEQDAKAEAKG